MARSHPKLDLATFYSLKIVFQELNSNFFKKFLDFYISRNIIL